MQIPGTAAPSAERQPPREVSFSSSGKGCCLFMSHMNPLKLLLCANGVGDAVERVARYAVDTPNSCFREDFHQQVRYFFLSHTKILFPFWKSDHPREFKFPSIHQIRRN